MKNFAWSFCMGQRACYHPWCQDFLENPNFLGYHNRKIVSILEFSRENVTVFQNFLLDYFTQAMTVLDKIGTFLSYECLLFTEFRKREAAIWPVQKSQLFSRVVLCYAPSEIACNRTKTFHRFQSFQGSSTDRCHRSASWIGR